MTDESRTENPPAAPVQPAAAAAPHGTESLDDLTREGATLEDLAAKPPAGAAAPAAATVTIQAEEVDEDDPPSVDDIVDMLEGVREAVAPMAEETGLMTTEELERIWNPKVLKRIAKPLAKLMERHGMGFGQAFDKFGPYVMVLVGIVGPSFATWKVIRAKLAAPAAPAGGASAAA